ncbi:MAG: glycoside hydrolase family 44 protein [Bryobacteraceae bacterium]
MRTGLKLGFWVVAAAAQAQQPPKLAVDAAANRHRISPYIYGINAYSDNGLGGMMRIPVRRYGGDATTSYNWQIDVANSASDWYFENFLQINGDTSKLPDGSSFDQLHEADLEGGTLTMGTISLMDWTPKDSVHCSYSVAKYGAQTEVNPYNSDCGKGLLLNGQQITNNDPNDAYQPVDQTFAQQWVAYLVNRYGPANQGGVRLWSMDNEPEWWYGVHWDIYKSPATYDDMMARNLKWAQAVKSADRTALVTGPVAAGWPGYFFSRADFGSGWSVYPYEYWDNPSDQRAHGGVPWVEYYLQQMKQFEQQHGYRLLDVLDIHGYITPDLLTDTPGTAEVEGLRMTSTRALWDPNYIVPNTNSGNNLYDVNGNEVAPQLVPRMRRWVDQNYPGTKIAITEYMWHGLQTITGAIAQADILGIFGRESLDYATLWGPPQPTDPGTFAFKMYLNYDGNGSQFGQTSVSATTDDPDTLSIFAAQRSDSALTVVVLNKTTAAITDTVSLQNFTAAGTAQVWQYSEANLGAIVRQANVNVSANAVTATFPKLSMTLFVIPQAQGSMSVPQPVISSVASAASYDSTAISPGEIVAVFGESLGPAKLAGLELDENGLVSTVAGGVQVLFNGYPAPIVYALDKQVAAVVPYAVAQFERVNVVVSYQGNASASVSVPVTGVRTALFTNDFSGHGQGAVLNAADYSWNSAANPVARGQYVAIYGTGEGVTNPPGMDGRPTGTPLPKPAAACGVTIGGISAKVTYCGEAPGLTAGVVQVNAQVPESITPGGGIPLSLTIGGVASQPNVTMAVK